MIAVGFVLFILAVFRVWLSIPPHAVHFGSRSARLTYGFMLLAGAALMLAGVAVWLYRVLP
jgi:hypothetical protein